MQIVDNKYNYVTMNLLSTVYIPHPKIYTRRLPFTVRRVERLGWERKPRTEEKWEREQNWGLFWFARKHVDTVKSMLIIIIIYIFLVGFVQGLKLMCYEMIDELVGSISNANLLFSCKWIGSRLCPCHSCVGFPLFLFSNTSDSHPVSEPNLSVTEFYIIHGVLLLWACHYDYLPFTLILFITKQTKILYFHTIKIMYSGASS